MTSARQQAETEQSAKLGGREIRMIMEPKYRLDERLGCYREVDKPSAILFEELGWDRNPEEPAEKHYRKFVASELEDTPEVMSKPSEFQCFTLKRGQTRGAKTGLFGGGKKDASGAADTTEKMGLFKALITITHKDTEEETKLYVLEKLKRILKLLSEIYMKRYNKSFPVRPGFFCEEGGATTSFVLREEQRERAYSDDIKGPEPSKEAKGADALVRSQSGVSSKASRM